MKNRLLNALLSDLTENDSCGKGQNALKDFSQMFLTGKPPLFHGAPVGGLGNLPGMPGFVTMISRTVTSKTSLRSMTMARKNNISFST
jgi:hypothetical protein